MLDVNLFNAVQAAYADLDLGNYGEYAHFIEIQANELNNQSNFRDRVAEANNAGKTLIVVRTTEGNNTLRLSGNRILDVGNFGGVVIASLGTTDLIVEGINNGTSGIFATSGTVAFAGLTITGGTRAGDGGAITNSGMLTIVDCTLSDNTASGFDSGGAIYSQGTYQTDASLTVTNSTISGNNAYNGGGIYAGGYSTLTITGGTLSENTASYGGGISAANTLTATGVAFTSNTADQGGSIYKGGGNAVLTVTNCAFTSTGALYNAGASATSTITGSTFTDNSKIIHTSNLLTVSNSIISGNAWTSGYGGGIQNSGTLTLNNVTITGNLITADYTDGGGIYNTGTLTVNNSTITENTITAESSSYARGGGIYSSGGTLRITDSNITENSTSLTVAASDNSVGGGIWSNSALTIERSTIAGNSATTSSGNTSSGGGIYTNASSASSFIINSVIAGNSATNAAGLYINAGAVTLTNSTIAGNYNGGINMGTGTNVRLTINNTIVAGNRTADFVSSGNYGTLSGDHNLIGNGANQSSLSDGINGNIVGSASDLIDAGFVTFGDLPTAWSAELYRGWNLDLSANSRARDAGNNGLALAPNGDDKLETDRLGRERELTEENPVDIGAYEYQGTVDPTTELESITPSTNSPSVGTQITTTLLPSGATATYQWYRGTSASNVTTVISGATGASYTPITADVGQFLRVTASGTGSYTGSASHTLTNAVTSLTTEITSITPSTNSPKVGDTITTTLDPEGATATYQWYRGASAINGAVYSSYTPTADDIGHYLSVEAVGTENYTGMVEHTLTNAVVDQNTTIELEHITPSTNSPLVGTQITTTLFPGDATATYQWYRDGYTINGAVYSSYTPTADDIGHYLSVEAVGTENYTGMVEHTLTNAVTDAAASKLSAPTLGTVTATGTNRIVVNWSTVENSSGYTIQYSTDVSFETGVEEKIITEGTTDSENITGLDADTMYYFRMKTTSTGEYEDSDWSVIKSATTDVVVSKLSTPTLTDVLSLGDGEIIVTWSTVPNADSYVVEYATTNSFTGKQTVESTGTWASLEILDAAVTYYFRVMAIGTGAYSDSDYSALESVLTPAIRLTVPKNVVVTNASASSLIVTWDKVDNAIGYRVEYSTDADFTEGSVTTRNISGSDTTSLGLTSLTMEQEYHVRVIALGNGDDYADSSASDSVSAKPEIILESRDKTSNSITLMWSNIPASAQVTDHTIEYREAGNGNWKTWVFTTRGWVTINALKPNTSYDFRLTTTTADGAAISTTISGVKTESSASSAAPSVKPALRGNTRAATVSSVMLTWKTTTKNTVNAAYEISYTTPTGIKTIVVAAGQNSVVIEGLKANTKYRFTVTALNANGEKMTARGKDAVQTVNAKTAKYGAVKVTKPSIRNGTLTANSVTLNWNYARPPLGNPTTHYAVYQMIGTNRNASYTLLETVPVSTTSVTITEINDVPLFSNTRYTFVVRAVVWDGVSESFHNESLNAKVTFKTAR